jgi:hypothetical protein
LKDRIQSELDRLVGGGLLGAFVYIEDPDGTLTYRTAGVADLESRSAITPQNHYRIGSTTKTFTAVSSCSLSLRAVSPCPTSFDTAAFFRSLLVERSPLPPELLAAMKTVLAEDPPPQFAYGLGLIRDDLPGCRVGPFGGRLWLPARSLRAA